MDLAKVGLSLGGLKALNSGLGFVLSMGVAILLGANELTDALFVAMMLPVNVASDLVGLIGIALVPCLVEEGIEKKSRLPALFMGWWVPALVVASVILVLAASPLVMIMAPGISESAHGEAVRLLKILSPSLFLFGLYGAGKAFLHARFHFFGPELAQTVWRIVAILALLVMGHTWGARGYAVGLVAAALGQFVFVVGTARRFGVSVMEIAIPGREVASLRPLMKASVVVGAFMLLDKATMVAERLISSYLSAGSISILSYSDRLARSLPIVLAGSFFTLFVPELTLAKSRPSDPRPQRRALAIFLLSFGLPFAILVFWSAQDLVTLVLKRGHFEHILVPAASATVKAYALGIPAFFCSMGLRSIFFVDRNLKEVVRLGLIALAITVAGDLLLFPLGVMGIALASTIMAWCVVFYLWWRFGIGWPRWRESHRLVLGGAVMAAVLFVPPWGTVLHSPLARLAIGGAFSSIPYGLYLYPYWRGFKSLSEAGAA